jgi:hypothetical protein
MSLHSKKLHLIHQILQINDVKLIDDLTAYVKGKNQNQILSQITTPIHPHFDLETMKQAQGHQPINKAEFDELIKELDIQEPLEDLLAMLTK